MSRTDRAQGFAIGLLVLFTLCQAAWGDGMQPDEKSDPVSVWLNPGFYSYHFSHNSSLNENNYGLGLRVKLSQDNSIMGGVFRNSRYADSRYLGWVWQPYQAGMARLGLWAGALDGYPKMNNGNWFLVALPLLSFEYRTVGLNLIIVPSYQDKVRGAIVGQLEFRIYGQ